MYLEESFPKAAADDAVLVGRLAQGLPTNERAKAILPRVGVTLPPPKEYCPFLLYRYDDFIRPDPGNATLLGVVHVGVYDLPGEWYWRINEIMTDLAVRIYKDSMQVWYDDPSGVAWQQQIAGIGRPDSDDGWNLLVRTLDVQLWRSPR